MAIKAILANVTIENAVTVWTRHDPPVALAHLRLSGPTGRQLYRALGGGPPDTWIPGLHALDDLPALAKKPDGKLAHQYAGSSRNPPLITGDEGQSLTLEQRRTLLEARGVWDVWLRGRGFGHLNGTATDKAPFCAIACDAQLLSLLAPAVAWTDQQPWSACPVRYKTADGSPRVDTDNARRWTEVSAAEPTGAPPGAPPE